MHIAGSANGDVGTPRTMAMLRNGSNAAEAPLSITKGLSSGATVVTPPKLGANRSGREGGESFSRLVMEGRLPPRLSRSGTFSQLPLTPLEKEVEEEHPDSIVKSWSSLRRPEVKAYFQKLRQDLDQAIAKSGIVTEVVTAEELESLPLWKQGNWEMYSDENLVRRKLIRNDSALQAVIKEWWNRCTLNKKGQLEKKDYIAMNKRIYVALVEDDDEKEAAKCAETDWQSDAKGKDYMTATQFSDSLYELADMWTMSTEAAEYVQFLQELLENVQALGWGQEKDSSGKNGKNGSSSSNNKQVLVKVPTSRQKKKKKKNVNVAVVKAAANAGDPGGEGRVSPSQTPLPSGLDGHVASPASIFGANDDNDNDGQEALDAAMRRNDNEDNEDDSKDSKRGASDGQGKKHKHKRPGKGGKGRKTQRILRLVQDAKGQRQVRVSEVEDSEEGGGSLSARSYARSVGRQPLTGDAYVLERIMMERLKEASNGAAIKPSTCVIHLMEKGWVSETLLREQFGPVSLPITAAFLRKSLRPRGLPNLQEQQNFERSKERAILFSRLDEGIGGMMPTTREQRMGLEEEIASHWQDIERIETDREESMESDSDSASDRCMADEDEEDGENELTERLQVVTVGRMERPLSARTVTSITSAATSQHSIRSKSSSLVHTARTQSLASLAFQQTTLASLPGHEWVHAHSQHSHRSCSSRSGVASPRVVHHQRIPTLDLSHLSQPAAGNATSIRRPLSASGRTSNTTPAASSRSTTLPRPQSARSGPVSVSLVEIKPSEKAGQRRRNIQRPVSARAGPRTQTQTEKQTHTQTQKQHPGGRHAKGEGTKKVGPWWGEAKFGVEAQVQSKLSAVSAAHAERENSFYCFEPTVPKGGTTGGGGSTATSHHHREEKDEGDASAPLNEVPDVVLAVATLGDRRGGLNVQAGKGGLLTLLAAEKGRPVVGRVTRTQESGPRRPASARYPASAQSMGERRLASYRAPVRRPVASFSVEERLQRMQDLQDQQERPAGVGTPHRTRPHSAPRERMPAALEVAAGVIPLKVGIATPRVVGHDRKFKYIAPQASVSTLMRLGSFSRSGRDSGECEQGHSGRIISIKSYVKQKMDGRRGGSHYVPSEPFAGWRTPR
jgi:hypothetical protein